MRAIYSCSQCMRAAKLSLRASANRVSGINNCMSGQTRAIARWMLNQNNSLRCGHNNTTRPSNHRASPYPSECVVARICVSFRTQSTSKRHHHYHPRRSFPRARRYCANPSRCSSIYLYIYEYDAH